MCGFTIQIRRNVKTKIIADPQKIERLRGHGKGAPRCVEGLSIIAVGYVSAHKYAFSHVKGKAFSRHFKPTAAFLDPNELMITKAVGTVNGNLLDALTECGQYKGKSNISVFVNFCKHSAISL
jgi:hypothetical protein